MKRPRLKTMTSLCRTDLRFSCRVSDLSVWTLSSRGKSFCSYGTWGSAVLTSGGTCAQTPPLVRLPDGRTQTRWHPPKTRWRSRGAAGCFVSPWFSAFPWNVHRGPLWPSDGALAAKCHMAGFQRALGFWPERIQKKRRRQNQGGDYMIHLITSIVCWHE